jgi:SAM-dependent methyltransferase
VGKIVRTARLKTGAGQSQKYGTFSARRVFRPTDPGLRANSCIFELGCGAGNYVCSLQAQMGCSAWGVDPSRDMLSKARSQGSDITWVCAPAESPGLADVQFDFIFSVDAVHHFHDRVRVFRESHRLLSAQGVICIATDSEDIIRNRTPLSTYWPETIEIELNRYPRIEMLEAELRDSGFVAFRQEMVCSSSWLTDLSAYKAKAFSCLRLLPEDSYRRGLEGLEADLAKGPVFSVSRYLLLWANR